VERKLTTVLCADVAGYSRLMSEDEEATLDRLNSYRDIVDALVSERGGRIFGGAGDSVIAEFPSPVEAVRCAAAIQRSLTRRNADVVDARRMLFRIGINLGDVMVDGDNLMGDGVNVAARLEELAEPGGICISASVHDHVAKKVDLGFEALGPQKLKNIADAVTAHRVVLEMPPAAARHTPTAGARRGAKVLVAVLCVAIISAAAAWLLWPRPKPPEAEVDDARPSIVVLPFDNLSGNPEEDYFSDGMTEDLITDLSHVSGLFVIARNTSFTFKGRAVSAKAIGRELGVRYVLEGSVRRADNRVRINAQLIEADTEYHVWSDRFDRQITDIFALQDEVAQRIVSALAVKLTSTELERFSREQETSPEAYDLMLRGIEQLRLYTSATNREARRFFLEATKFDPDYARAWANIAFTYSIEPPFGWTDDPDESVRLAIRYADKATALDDRIVQVHLALSNIYVRQRRFGEAIAQANRSVQIDPNYADGYAALTLALLNAGRYEEALLPISKALRLDPRGPFFYHWLEGRCLFQLERYEEAREKFELVAERNPDFVGGLKYLAATYSVLGRIDDAKWIGEEILARQPGFTLTKEREAGFTADSVSAERDKTFIEGLRLAGIPE